MFSTIVKTTSYTSGMVRNLLRAESHFARSISTSNDVKNSDLLTKNEPVGEAPTNKDIKKIEEKVTVNDESLSAIGCQFYRCFEE